MDYGVLYTENQIKKLEHEIHIVYTQAEIDIRHKMEDFNKKYRVKERIHAKELKEGKITQEQFDNWKKGQVFQSEQWKAKREQILDTMHNSNKIAADIVNGKMNNVFMINANYANYDIEHKAGVNFGFGIYDSATVATLIKDNPQVLPKWKINEPKDYTWSQKKVNRSITQGIIQGESLDKIAKRLTNKLVTNNENKMKTFARTAMTEAQNAGRFESMKAAKNLGIDLYKEWMATLDSHTRDSHADVDGEKVPLESKFSNGLMYPAEPGGAPAEVYNCRCTMVSDIKKYPSKYQRYDNINRKPIDNMTYRQWEASKSKSKPAKTADTKKDKYSQEKKDAAFWARNSRDADNKFRKVTGEIWKNASADEREAAYRYTCNSDGFNMPLRGYRSSWGNYEGIGKVPLDNQGKGKQIEDLTKLLENSHLQQDTWIQRGVSSMEGASNFVGVPADVLRNATQEELQQLLVGKEIADAGFMSCGSARGEGFDGDLILNIFCPEGTQALYCEPFSRYGGSHVGTKWDGESPQSEFGELETLLQRNSQFVITKVEKSYGQLYIDIDLIGQDPYAINYLTS